MQLQDEVHEGTMRAMEERPSVGRYLDQYLEDVRTTIKPSSLLVYNRWVKHFILRYGHIQLSDLTRGHVDQWRSELVDSGLAGNTVNTGLRVIKGALIEAVKRDLIHRNPAAHIRYVDANSREREFPPFWTSEQFEAYMKTVENPRHRLAFCLAFYAGLRLQEAAYLRWEDIQDGVIKVTSHGQRRTKTDNTRRIPVAQKLQEELDKWERGTGPILRAYSPEPSPTAISKAFIRLKRAYNEEHIEDPLPDISFHGLRHSFATNLAPHVQLFVLSRLLGHSKIETTMIYAHVQDDVTIGIASAAMHTAF